jgi:putative aldouronate transport system substrate-binding protein
MANVSAHPTLSRRAFVQRLGGTALVSAFGAQLLAACSSPPPAAPTAAPAAAPTTAPAAATAVPQVQAKPTTAAPATVAAVVSRSGRVTLPTYVPPADAPPPDVPGGAITPPGYTRYPAKLVRSVANPPAKGGEITIVTQTLGTTPTPMDSNPVWQELNKRVGATLKISITPFADYGAKIPTIIAGNDLPDMLFLPNGQPVPGFPQFLEARCADLTPYLSGDAVKEYPNLAAHPTQVWKATVINNKIFGVGDPIPPYFWVHWHHQELLEQAKLDPPKNGADYKMIMQTLTKPNEGLFGIIGEAGYQYGYGTVNQLFTSLAGGPNQWSVNNGKLTRLFETDSFKAAVDYARDLWAAGLYEPGSPGYNVISARAAMLARKGVFRWDGNTADIFNSQGAPANLQPPPKIRLLTPFPLADGVTPTYPIYHGSFGTIVLKKAPEDRIKELLRVLNLLAAPFGTEEREIIGSGLEGRDFTRNDKGAPILNEQGRADLMLTTIQNIVNPAPAYFDPVGGDYVPHVIGVFKQYEAVGLQDPTVGFYSESAGRQGVVANQRFGDGINDIITGRRPFSDLGGLVNEWRTNGGDQVRKEFEEAMAAAG